MKITAPPRSDQWNADDLIAGPVTVTITGVVEGKAEQRYDIQLAEGNGRVWRPPSTVLRILIAAWGDEADVWIGRRATLYRDDSVKFGPEAVGGIRVSHLSDLPGGKALSGRVTSTRGKRVPFTVQPLTDAAPKPAAKQPKSPAAPTPEQVAESTDADQLREWWGVASPGVQKLIEARAAQLKGDSND